MASPRGFAGVTRVEQARGGGKPWTRRARALRNGVPLEEAESFARPLVAVADATVLAAATMPWMRYREPQALVVDGARLGLRIIGEDLVVGEGKAIWGAALLHFQPPQSRPDGRGLSQGVASRRRGAS